MTELLSTMEKKIRIRAAKRVQRRVANQIPVSRLGTWVLKQILFIEKTLRKE